MFHVPGSLNQRFIRLLDEILESTVFDGFEKYLQHHAFLDTVTTSYYWRRWRLVIDVVDEECCLTSPDINVIYVFDADDVEEVVLKVIEEIQRHS